MGRREVFQDVEAFAEVRPDRGLDDLARGLGHQPAHGGELLHLADIAAGAGLGHEVDGVEIPSSLVGVDGELLVVARIAAVMLQRLDETPGDQLAAVGPQVQQLVVSLALGDRSRLVVPLHAVNLLLGLVDQLLLIGGQPDVGDPDREPRNRRYLEAQLLHVVQGLERCGASEPDIRVVDHTTASLHAQGAVIEGHAIGQDVREEDSAEGGHVAAMLGGRLGFFDFTGDHLGEAGKPDNDGLLELDVVEVKGKDRLVRVLEVRNLVGGPLVLVIGDGQEVDAHDDVLARRDDRLAVSGREYVVR